MAAEIVGIYGSTGRGWRERWLAGRVGIALAIFGLTFGVAHSWPATQLYGTWQVSEVEVYKTLKEMAEAADMTARGQIVAVKPGRVFGEEGDFLHYARLDLIGEDLKGDKGTVSVPIEIPLPEGVAFSDLDHLKGIEGIFVLRNKGVEARNLGMDPHEIESEAQFYRPSVFAGVLLEHDGKITFPFEADGPMVEAWKERSFDDALAAVKSG